MQQTQPRSSVRPDIGEDSRLAQDTADRTRRALLVLAAGAFAVGTDAFVIAGILPAVAHGVGVSVNWAGALMTGFALTYAVAAPVLSVTFGRLPRRGLLVAALTGFAIANALAAVAPSFALLMAARVVAALAAALFTPTASALAAELAPPGRRGRALAAIAIGLTVAQVAGVPLGSLAGSLLGWRASFVAVAILGAAAAIGTRAALPFAGPSGAASPLGDRIRLAGSRPVWPILAQTAAATTAGFAVLTYIAPIMHAAANLNGASISVVLAGFGAASALGSALGGRWTDRRGALPVAATALLVLAASLAGLAVATSYHTGPVSLVFIAAWGMGGWALIPAQQHRLLSAAPEQSTVLLGLNSSAIYFGATLGSILGALTLAFSPAATVSTASAIAAAAAVTVIARAWRHRAATCPRQCRQTGSGLAVQADRR
jgi:DHA1 family inner membrane transport protein